MLLITHCSYAMKPKTDISRINEMWRHCDKEKQVEFDRPGERSPNRTVVVDSDWDSATCITYSTDYY